MRRSSVLAAAAIGVLVILGAIGVFAVGLLAWPASDDAATSRSRPIGPAPDETAPAETAPAETAPAETAGPPAPAGLSLPATGDPAAVLAAADGPVLDPAAVRAALRPALGDSDLARHTGVVVRDLVRDREVLRAGGAEPYVPASTLKLLTTAAALSVLGPDHRFGTTVLRADDAGRAGRSRPSLVLVGGGDPLLATSPGTAELRGYPEGATVLELAAQAARALRADGVGAVRVGYDDTLFVGRTVAASWEPGYVPNGVVSPISALLVDGGPLGAGATDPAQVTADAFVQALWARGIEVVGGAPLPARAPADGDVIGRVTGAALQDVVGHVLQFSDNEGAEVLLRHVGLATGRPGSFGGGVAGMREVLTGLGVSLDSSTLYDGSGLSRANRVDRAAVAQVVQLGADPARPELRAVTTELPVARFTGSLASRFVDASSAAGRGLVRAKTGTLTQVHALAGTVVTRDGTLLGFVVLADRVRLRDNLDAQLAIERVPAALAACGCSD